MNHFIPYVQQVGKKRVGVNFLDTFSRIRIEYRTGKTPNLNTFHAMSIIGTLFLCSTQHLIVFLNLFLEHLKIFMEIRNTFKFIENMPLHNIFT